MILRGGMDARGAGIVDLVRGKSAPAVRALLIRRGGMDARGAGIVDLVRGKRAP